MISGPKKEEVLLLPKNIMAPRHKQAGFPYNSPDTSKGICVQARGNHPPTQPSTSEQASEGDNTAWESSGLQTPCFREQNLSPALQVSGRTDR